MNQMRWMGRAGWPANYGTYAERTDRQLPVLLLAPRRTQGSS
jgi:hypothetical protein